jgi:hypothetical protein
MEEEVLWSTRGQPIRPEEMDYRHRKNTINMMISKVRNDLENSTFEPSGLSDNLELEKHAFEMNVKTVLEGGDKAIFKYIIQHYPAIRRMAELNGII